MDYVEHFLREVAALEAAGWLAAGSEAAPAVPSCPEWVVTDLVLHLGLVHRFVARVISERMQEPPGRDDRSWLGLADEWRTGCLLAARHGGPPVPPLCLAGSMPVRRTCRSASVRLTRPSGCGPGRQTTVSVSGSGCRRSRLLSTGHDAENAVGAARPFDAALAADATGQTFEVMAPMRRAVAKAPPGHGERLLFQRTDGPGT